MTKKLPTFLSSLFIGIPGGLLIFMGMLMFNAVLGLVAKTGAWSMLVILCFTSLIVGMLVRWMQPFHGIGSAIASGVVAALLILTLWLTSKAGSGMTLVFGPAGMIVTVGFSLLGAWVFPRLRKRKK